MNKQETIFRNASDSVRMTDAEKARIRAVAFPAPARPVVSPWVTFFRTHVPATAFVALLFFTGATSAIAERSLPGDILYPVKTNVNEPAASLVVRRGPDAETRWEARIAKRRLDEAKALLDSPSGADELLASKVRAAAEKRIARLEELTGATADNGGTDDNQVQAVTLMVASMPAEEDPAPALMMSTEPVMTEFSDVQTEQEDDQLREVVTMKTVAPAEDGLPENGQALIKPDDALAGSYDREAQSAPSDGYDRLPQLEAQLTEFEGSRSTLSLKAQAVFYRAQALTIDARVAYRAGDKEGYEKALAKLSRSLERLETLQASPYELLEGKSR
jgi:hypothetical protein